MSASSIELFSFSIWSCSSKKGLNQTFKAMGLVLSRLETIGLWIEIPMQTETGRWGKFDWDQPQQKNSNFCWFTKWSSIKNCLSRLNDRWTKKIQVFHKCLRLSPRSKENLHPQSCVHKCRPSLVKYNQASTHRCLHHGKSEIFIASVPQLRKKIHVIQPQKSLNGPSCPYFYNSCKYWYFTTAAGGDFDSFGLLTACFVVLPHFNQES